MPFKLLLLPSFFKPRSFYSPPSTFSFFPLSSASFTSSEPQAPKGREDRFASIPFSLLHARATQPNANPPYGGNRFAFGLFDSDAIFGFKSLFVLGLWRWLHHRLLIMRVASTFLDLFSLNHVSFVAAPSFIEFYTMYISSIHCRRRCKYRIPDLVLSFRLIQSGASLFPPNSRSYYNSNPCSYLFHSVDSL